MAEHQPERCDELRIIAGEPRVLDKSDRAALLAAADELEHAHKLLLAVNAQLIEANGHRIALTEQLDIARSTERRLIDQARQLEDQVRTLRDAPPMAVAPLLRLQLSSGWIKAQPR